jgi:hypothetical protein
MYTPAYISYAGVYIVSGRIHRSQISFFFLMFTFVYKLSANVSKRKRVSKTVRDDVSCIFHALCAFLGMSVVMLFEGERHQQLTIALRAKDCRFKLDPDKDLA